MPAIFLLCLSLLSQLALAQETEVSLEVRLDENLVYCQASIVTEQERRRISRALADGTTASLHWTIAIERVRKYWLDDEVATLEVYRKIIPDLVSRTWRLVDESAGIERRTKDIDEAIRFVSVLNEFPMIDRSLLEKNERFRLVLSLDSELKRVSDGLLKRWTGKMWGHESFTATVDFSIP